MSFLFLLHQFLKVVTLPLPLPLLWFTKTNHRTTETITSPTKKISPTKAKTFFFTLLSSPLWLLTPTKPKPSNQPTKPQREKPESKRERECRTGMGDMYHYDKNLSSSSSSSQDEISLFLRQILLRSSSSPAKNAHNSMPGSCNSNSNAAAQENAHPSFQDGISPLDSTSSAPAFLSASIKAGQGGSAPAANVSSSSLGVSENETDDYDCESEEGVEALAEEVPTRSVPSRSSSKRSRAAEVHNLSEKRRRSRINEKMKALQNLIPNSNKTDKASMLDEAIEYLKQLQLQVQMLSMRNGLSLHPMCFPEGLQPLQLSQMRRELNEENRSIPINMTATLPLHQENPLHYASNLPHKHTVPNQPSMPYPSYINNSETSFGLESPILAHIKPLQLRRSSEITREDILQQQQQQSNASHLDTNPLGGSQVGKEFESGTLPTVSLSFDMQTSEPKDNSSLQTCIAGRDQSGVILRNSEPNIVLTSQLSRLQTGSGAGNGNSKTEKPDF